jgi:hypothetical protein
MSATRKGQRVGTIDNYPTPTWPIERFFEEFELPTTGKRWLEPSVGDGVICNVANRFVPGIEWTTCDIRDTRAALVKMGVRSEAFVGDFLSHPEFDPELIVDRFDVMITNPPFCLTAEFVKRGLAIADVLILLQRANYVGTAERNELFREETPDLYMVPNRIDFTGDGKSDNIENAWHVWTPDRVPGIGSFKLLRDTPKSDRVLARARVIKASETAPLRDPKIHNFMDSFFSD